MDFRSLREVDNGSYEIVVTCEDRLPHSGDTYCTNIATHRHRDAGGDYIFICDEHRCRRCRKVKKLPCSKTGSGAVR